MLLHIETNKLKTSALLEFTDSEYPVALKMFIGGKISIETLRILDDFTDVISKWKEHPTVKYIWDDELRQWIKTKDLIQYRDPRRNK